MAREKNGSKFATINPPIPYRNYKMFKQATGTMILLVYVGSMVI